MRPARQASTWEPPYPTALADRTSEGRITSTPSGVLGVHRGGEHVDVVDILGIGAHVDHRGGRIGEEDGGSPGGRRLAIESADLPEEPPYRIHEWDGVASSSDRDRGVPAIEREDQLVEGTIGHDQVVQATAIELAALPG